MMFKLILVASQLSLITGFGIGLHSNQFKRVSATNGISKLKMSSEEYERPTVQIKRIVESLANGEKSGSEVEQELKAVETENKLLEISTGVSGALLGLFAGGILDGALANGDAPWAGPVAYAVLGGAAYYGAIQKEKEDISELLISVFGKPTLKAVKSVLASIKLSINKAKASAIKKVEDTVDDIVRVPISIRNSIVEAKDDAVTKVQAIPVNLQSAAAKSYEDAKQSAILKVDNKVAELKAIPVRIQENSKLAAKNAQKIAATKAEDILEVIKATPQRLLDAFVLKVTEILADIAQIPKNAASSAQKAYETKKQEITTTIESNVKSVQNAVDSILPSDDKK